MSCWWHRPNLASSCLSAKDLVHRSKAITASAMPCNAPPKPAKSCRTSLRFFRPSPFPGSNSYLFPSLPLSLHLRIPSISRKASTQGPKSRRPSPFKTDRSNIPSCYHPSSRVSPPPVLILFQSPTPPRTSYTETWPTNQSHHTLSMSPYLQGIPPAQSSSQLPTPNRLFPQSEPHHWSVTVHPPAAQHTHIPS